MSLKRPVTIAQARQWPAAAARRESFCARMGGMRTKLTSERTARDPRSKINQALAAWDCDVPELLEPKHVSKGVRPMKITRKMVGAEAMKNPAQRFTAAQMKALRINYARIGGIDPDSAAYEKLIVFLDGLPLELLKQLAEAKPPIPFVSGLARNRVTRASNPARKPTVSRKISQLVREGYPQRQAVAIALSEQRAGKVRKNPRLDTKAAKAPSSRASLSGRRMVYQVQESRDGKVYEAWATVLYPEMAKEIARRRAAEKPGLFVRVMSFKVEV